MLLGRVARHKIPGCASDQSYDGAHPKGGSPAVVNHDVGDQSWRNACSSASARKNKSICDSALRRGNPARNELIRSRVNDRFAGPQKESYRRKEKHSEDNFCGERRGESGEDSPPDNSRGECSTRAEAVGEPSPKRLESPITPKKGAENPAKLNIGQMIFGGDGTPGNGNVDAVEVSNRTQNKKSKHHEPAHAAFWTVRHARFLDSKGRQTWTHSANSVLPAREQQR